MRCALLTGVVLLGAGCGRVGFAPSSDADVPLLGDAVRSPLEVASTSCTVTAATLTPSRAIAAGETLIALLVMREPTGPTAPTITGTSLWATDVSFATTESTNRRHVSVFRSVLTAPVGAGEPIEITHPQARATAAILLAFPNAIQLTTAASTAEGDASPISASYTSTSPTTACIVAHPNNAGMVFDAGWTPLLELQPECGGSRESAGVHVALSQAAGTVVCSGTLASGSLAWASVLVGYADLL